MVNYLDIKFVPVVFQPAVESFNNQTFSIVRAEDTDIFAEIETTASHLLEAYGNEPEVREYVDQITADANVQNANFLKALLARMKVQELNINNKIEPRKNLWKVYEHRLSELLVQFDELHWEWVTTRIPSLTAERLEFLVEKLKSYTDLDKGERMQLIFLELLSQESGSNAEETYQQLLDKIIEVETIFVPWQTVLENQIRNSHQDILDPMELATQYRRDALTIAFADATANIHPSQRDQFYRGIMKPPSPTACRKNVFNNKFIYALTGHVVVIDNKNGAIVVHHTPRDCGFQWWFDQDFFRRLPEDSYVFSRQGNDNRYVWDNYEFNENADLSGKSG